MAKIIGIKPQLKMEFSVTNKKGEDEVITLDRYQIHVVSRAPEENNGLYCAVYSIQAKDWEYIFGNEKPDKSIFNRECIIEKTLDGTKERITSVLFYDKLGGVK